ncbi:MULTISPECIES: hypothetical protein [Kitasatospora]|uniref:Uncharacterized protein n=1 Tax=Kitasatospora cathayae TaxID=3004092 RepID=A0ABY7QDQ7_9ACTN|nr:hypothetical protein [Kitasatospora sp. HUAS 3-15]WBP90903.1 hypothetical protein O1G21_36915 [Kitasatospora sp. HUAS 3-15]
MRGTELLRAHAAELAQECRDHDPAAFTRGLAERLAAGRRAVPTGRERPARPPTVARPPHAPAAGDHPWGAGRSDLRRDLRHLCAGVVGAVEPGELALDLELAEKAAFRTLGCLLYGMGRTADGVFWWRIATQYGDQLAVHCLAVHYAAEGERRDAARWAAEAEDLSDPGRLPELAPAARPGRAAELARLLAERYDGEILLTLRGAVAARPGADPGRLGVRAVRGRGVVRIR